jgi:HSP20 family protein
MRRELDELWASWPDPRAVVGAGFVPAADVEELDDAWVVDIELPGVAKKDVEIEKTANDQRRRIEIT